jgi:hypothetical protein
MAFSVASEHKAVSNLQEGHKKSNGFVNNQKTFAGYEVGRKIHFFKMFLKMICNFQLQIKRRLRV